MDDLLNEFLSETIENLGLLDSELVRLEQNPNDPTLLQNIFRVVHTIKGTCGFLGLSRLQHLGHAAENVLGKFRDGTLAATPDAIELVLASVDGIKSIVNTLAATQKEPAGDDAALIAELNRLADGPGADGADTAETAPAPEDPFEGMAVQAVPEAEAALPVAEPIVPEMDAAAIGKAAESAKSDAAAASDLGAQAIRVNVDLLEDLMTIASELVLTRNQLMQILRTQKDSVFGAALQRLSQVTTELQEGVMKTRMQPIGNAWAKLPRLVRDLARDLGKKTRFAHDRRRDRA
jgi:two-component system chemotaxis sensor kinase CheA